MLILPEYTSPGLKLGFPKNAADVRVAQYESETRIPKDDLINAFANLFENINSWQAEYEKLTSGEITQEEYDVWRYKYPQIETERKDKSQSAAEYLGATLKPEI